MSEPASPPKVDPAALTIEQLSRILSTVGNQRVDVDWIELDLVSGAPRNGDGTINIVQFAAWLVSEMGRRET